MFGRGRIESRKIGLPPGTLIHIGQRKVDKTRIRVLDYDEKSLDEREPASIEACFDLIGSPTVTWINIDGLHEVDVIEKIGGCFNLHPLVLEDIVHTEQRPKLEDYEDYLFIICKMLFYDHNEEQVMVEQFSMILGPHYLITFQEGLGDVFDPIRERLRKGKGRIRKMGADYLAYALLDAIVDSYFIVLEKMGESLEVLEDEVVAGPTPETLQSIHYLKRELIFLRKALWPLREVVGVLERRDSHLVDEKTTVYLRDVYDHTIQVIETVETYRDMVTGMLDVYLSGLSNRMNEVMKVLTIMATLFIPLTFIAGVYGMNFKHMPELQWAWGYPLIWGVMALVAGAMLLYFRSKRWL
jgi:magnesium transporter